VRTDGLTDRSDVANRPISFSLFC